MSLAEETALEGRRLGKYYIDNLHYLTSKLSLKSNGVHIEVTNNADSVFGPINVFQMYFYC